MTDPRHPDGPQRDPALDAAWKAHSTELPPRRLDAAILAAAHREAHSRPHAAGDADAGSTARGPWRAWWGLAAAATIGAIAFGVVQMAPPPEADDAKVVASDVPPTVQKRAAQPSALPPPQPPVTEAAPALREPEAKVRSAPQAPPRKPPVRDERREQAAAIEPRPFPATPAPPPPAALPAEALAKRESTPVAPMRADEAATPRQREAGKLAAAPAQSEAQRTAALSPPRDAERAARTPAAWIEEIRRLHDAQRFAEAARELNAFRAAHADADARLPAELRSWAQGVKRE